MYKKKEKEKKKRKFIAKISKFITKMDWNIYDAIENISLEYLSQKQSFKITLLSISGLFNVNLTFLTFGGQGHPTDRVPLSPS